MQKTKLGLSAGMLGCIAVLVAAFGGYIPALLILGYVLIAEDNAWLKKTVTKAFLVLLIFSVLGWLVGLIPSLLGLVSEFLSIFKVSFYPSVIHNLFGIFSSILSLVKTILLLFMAVMAALEKNIKIPGLEKKLNQFFE